MRHKNSWPKEQEDYLFFLLKNENLSCQMMAVYMENMFEKFFTKNMIIGKINRLRNAGKI